MRDVVGEPSELREVDVAQVTDVPGKAVVDLRDAEHEQDRHRSVKQRKNSQKPPDVKALENRSCRSASGLHGVARRPEDAGDQKTAEDEKQLNADEPERQIERCLRPEVV